MKKKKKSTNATNVETPIIKISLKLNLGSTYLINIKTVLKKINHKNTRYTNSIFFSSSQYFEVPKKMDKNRYVFTNVRLSLWINLEILSNLIANTKLIKKPIIVGNK